MIHRAMRFGREILGAPSSNDSFMTCPQQILLQCFRVRRPFLKELMRMEGQVKKVFESSRVLQTALKTWWTGFLSQCVDLVVDTLGPALSPSG